MNTVISESGPKGPGCVKCGWTGKGLDTGYYEPPPCPACYEPTTPTPPKDTRNETAPDKMVVVPRAELECLRLEIHNAECADELKAAYGLRWRTAIDECLATPAARRGCGDARDAERYRWLREHFRFANGSLHEIWFDSSLAQGADWIAPQLDKEIDAALQPAATPGKE